MKKTQIAVNHAPNLLLVANVAKEHVLKFHIPTIKMLKKHGWTVEVACSGDEIVPYCDTQYRLSYQRSPFNWDFFKGICELTKIINTGSYDVVYCHTPVGGVAARIAAIRARKKGTKVIYMAHGYHFFRGAPKMNWLIYYPVEKMLSRVTDAIILINREDYELTSRKFKHCKAYLIDGIGIDFDRFDLRNRKQIRESYRYELGIPQNAQVLIYLAELIPNKNQTYLLNVLKKLLNDSDDVYLVLAGFDHSYGGVQHYAEEIGVAEHVRFLGWREDVSNLYIMSDVCTATSIREGFGLNLVEAMYCGIPVVATKNRGQRRILGEWRTQKRILFPGYVFVITEQIEELYRQLANVIGMTRILGTDGEIIPLTEKETELLLAFGGREQVVKMSEGIIENSQVIITSGPLQGREGMIKKIDRHKRKVWLEMEMFGRMQTVQMGLEIISKTV